MPKPIITEEMLRSAFCSMHGVPGALWDAMPDEVKEHARGAVRESLEKAMGNEPYFDSPVLLRLRLAKIAEGLTPVVRDLLTDSGMTKDEYLLPVSTATAYLMVALGACSDAISEDEAVRLVRKYFEIVKPWSTTHRLMAMLVFVHNYIDELSEAKHWEHQEPQAVADLLKEVRGNED